MIVQNINYTNRNINFKGKNNTQLKNNQPTPLKDGIKTAEIWLAIGLGLDCVSKKCVIFKNSPVKNSIAINSAVAFCAGAVTTAKDVIQQKNKF